MLPPNGGNLGWICVRTGTPVNGVPWYNIWLTQDLIPKEIILNIIEHFAPINTYEANKMDDKQIEKQVERWDPFHELCPVFPRSGQEA